MKYDLNANKFKPEIIYSIEKGEILISGYAIFESDKEYIQINLWLDEYLTQNKDNITVIFKIKYLNSLAVKLFTKLLIRLKEKFDSKNLKVIWYYYDDNILENVDDIEFITDLKISKVLVNEE